MSRIIRLQVENVKRIKAVDISPPASGTLVIGGANGAGKSSVLDAIMYALGGGRGIPDQPLRVGEKQGFVKVDLGDLIVDRRFTEKGTTLVITSKDGYEAPTPQKILDDLFSRFTFDPLAFSRDKPKDQLAVLRSLVGIEIGRAHV